MYLSEVRLVNWRSYQDATFRFPKPPRGKPLALIGAMNGHGKTSLMLGLYFGMFGRFGVRFAEGFQIGTDDASRLVDYRRALQEFRRRGTDDDDPTEIRITLSPTANDPTDVTEFRIERRWFFKSSGEPRDGDAGETAHVWVDNIPQKVSALDDAKDLLESHVFPAHVLPAFFFDGEQAQKRIEESGDAHMRGAVEVLYGTKLLADVRDELRLYAQRVRRENPGLQQSRNEQQLEKLRRQRDEIEARLNEITKETGTLGDAKREANASFEGARQQLTLLGVSTAKQIDRLATQMNAARTEMETHNNELRDIAKEMAIPLALVRFGSAIIEQLHAERLTEEWETIKSGTQARVGAVIERAFPEPDPLLRKLSSTQIDQLKTRFQNAIEAIYQPPPAGYAEVIRFGHVHGEGRDALRQQVVDAAGIGTRRVEALVRVTRHARDAFESARRRHEKHANVEEQSKRIGEDLERAQTALGELNRQIGSLAREDQSLREDLKQKRAEIGRLETDIKRLAPAAQRIEMANRLRDVLGDFAERLAPLALKRLESSVTEHFRHMADKRFKNGTVHFESDGTPILDLDGQRVPLRTMSGYERRTFGVAFSIALAEVSGFRAPLVIDTPLGNADSEYRLSLLKHIVRADLDQIVILTHDEEVVGRYHEAIKDRVAKYYLVRYEQLPAGGESFVFENRYFGTTHGT